MARSVLVVLRRSYLEIPRLRQIALALLAAAVGLGSCSKPPRVEQPLTISGPTMGTQYTIKLGGLPPGVSAATLTRQIDSRLRQIERQMSTYIRDSEVSRFNRAPAGSWFEVSAETASVVEAAQGTSRMTDGAFDITVGPLVDLWNFGPNQGERGLPTAHQLDAAMQRVGYTGLIVRRDPPALKKNVAELHIDLSALAKGYAVDSVGQLLRQQGVLSYMVEIGGEICVHGSRPGGYGWRIGIESPLSGQRQIGRVVQLQDAAMATSGDYRNFFEIGGRRYSHAIDPATGRPVLHALASVTVLARDCMTADALATALLVMGPENSLAWADEHGIAALLIVRTETGFDEQASRQFPVYR